MDDGNRDVEIVAGYLDLEVDDWADSWIRFLMKDKVLKALSLPRGILYSQFHPFYSHSRNLVSLHVVGTFMYLFIFILGQMSCVVGSRGLPSYVWFKQKSYTQLY